MRYLAIFLFLFLPSCADRETKKIQGVVTSIKTVISEVPYNRALIETKTYVTFADGRMICFRNPIPNQVNIGSDYVFSYYEETNGPVVKDVVEIPSIKIEKAIKNETKVQTPTAAN